MTAKKTSKASTGKDGRPEWQGFFNWNPTREHKDGIKALELSFEDLPGILLAFVDHGYRVSFDWDSRSDCWMVMVQGTTYESPNPGKAMSMRHADLLTALLALYFFNHALVQWGPWIEDDWYQTQFDW